MESKSLDECIALIKNGQKVEARQSLQKILESDLHNLNGWYWYVETFDAPDHKVKALRLCLKYNPDNQKVKDAIQTFETKYPQVMKSQPTNNLPVPKKAQPPRNKKSNKNLWIVGAILVTGFIGIFCVLVIGFLLSNQLPATISPPKPTSVPTITSTPKPFAGNWQVSTSQSEFDNSTTVALSLEAENYIEGWLTTTLPTLVLRCKERKMNVYVNVGTQSNVEYGRYGSATVRVRFDQNQAIEMIADESTDGDALFFRDPYGMIIAMLRSKEMVFGFTPFNADPAVTTFDLRGLANVIAPLKQSCNWNGAYPTFPPLPTLPPTATPLPSGSALIISGIDNKKWRIEIERIEVTKSVTAFGNTTNAGGQFVLLFLRVTNTGNDPQIFIGFGNIQIKDASGIAYDEEITVSDPAADMYGVPYAGMIQPGDVAQKLVAFDLPLDSTFYLLMPGSLADNNGQSIVIEIP
jgi:type VI secretion system protein VasI